MSVRILDRVRQPEYTGENRCVPCTVFNVAIAAVVSTLFAVAWLPLGVAVFAVSAVTIHLRGYLVPGTPTITSRYFPDRVLRLFDKEGDDIRPETDAEDGASDIEEVLISSGVVEACDDDLCLAEEFRESWSQRMEAAKEAGRERERRLLAESIQVDADALGLEENGRLAVNFEGDRIASWKSRSAFLADLTAEQELEDWCNEWDEMRSRERSRVISSLRVFLEDCPSCGSRVVPAEDAVDTCCGKSLVNVTLECEGCGDVVFEGRYR